MSSERKNHYSNTVKGKKPSLSYIASIWLQCVAEDEKYRPETGSFLVPQHREAVLQRLLTSILSLGRVNSMIIWLVCAWLEKGMHTFWSCVYTNVFSRIQQPCQWSLLQGILKKCSYKGIYFELSISCSVIRKMTEDEYRGRLTA